MTALTILVPDKSLQKLQELALRFRVAPEELIRISLEELLTRPKEDFKKALAYVFHKNAELYRLLV